MGTTSFSASTPSRNARANLNANLGAIAQQARIISQSLGEIGNSLGGTRPASLRQFLDSVGLSGLPLPSLANARTCGVPSCDCASPDLGEIRRVLDRPEAVQIGARFRNTTSKQRTFALTAGKIMSEDGKEGGTITVSPDSVTLEPGEVAVVQISVDASKYATGVDHAATIKVSSEKCQDMYLGVVVLVQPEVKVVPVVDLHCCCTPKLRPLRWYHHYYCDPAPERGDQTPQPNPNSTTGVKRPNEG